MGLPISHQIGDAGAARLLHFVHLLEPMCGGADEHGTPVPRIRARAHQPFISHRGDLAGGCGRIEPELGGEGNYGQRSGGIKDAEYKIYSPIQGLGWAVPRTLPDHFQTPDKYSQLRL
jgi:hypothetical protein